jgi:hypothetical protein
VGESNQKLRKSRWNRFLLRLWSVLGENLRLKMKKKKKRFFGFAQQIVAQFLPKSRKKMRKSAEFYLLCRYLLYQSEETTKLKRNPVTHNNRT